MGKKTTVYIHIGTGKTGTTYIQYVLSKNFFKLKEKYKVLYPKLGGRIANTHHNVFFAIKNDDRFTLNIKKRNFVNYLRKEIDKSDCEKVIISSEFFWSLSPKKLKEWLPDEYEYKIILFVRRQDDWLESAYAQRIKAPLFAEYNYDQTIYSLDTVADFNKMLSEWENQFGFENIKVKKFEKNNDDLALEFLKLCNVYVEDLNGIGEKRNLSLEPEQLSYLLAINKLKLDKNSREHYSNDIYKKDFFDVVKSLRLLFSRNINFKLIPEKTKRDFFDKYYDTNNLIAKRYMNTDILFEKKDIQDDISIIKPYSFEDILKIHSYIK